MNYRYITGWETLGRSAKDYSIGPRDCNPNARWDGDRRVLALMHTLCLFALSSAGFRHRDVRAAVAQLLGRDAAAYAASQMTYDLRRLRLHGLIDRVPESHRYRITDRGARIAMLYVWLHARGFRPGASLPTSGSARGPRAFEHLNAALTNFLQEVRLVA